MSQVGYFYGGVCEGYCLLTCDSSVEASMIVVEEKLLGRKKSVVYEEGRTEWNRTASIYCIICPWSAKNKSFLRITAILCCTGDSVPSFGLYSKNWSMLISSKPGIISDLKTYYLLYKIHIDCSKTYYLLYKIHIDCSEQSKLLLAFNLFSV